MNKFLKELMTLATELNKEEGFNALTVIHDMELLYERHVAEVVKNLTLHDVRLSLIAYEEAKHSFLPPKYRKETATNIVSHVLGNL